MFDPPASLRAFPPKGDDASGRYKPGHVVRWPGMLRGHPCVQPRRVSDIQIQRPSIKRKQLSK